MATVSPAYTRLPWQSILRAFTRKRFFSFLEKIGQTDDARDIAARSLVNILRSPARAHLLNSAKYHPPYKDLGTSRNGGGTAHRSDIIMITARFRSGSTLLWNIFRHLGECTAYYEPFNERRWFDEGLRGNETDATHRQVTDYWREYSGLEELGNLYSEDWIRREFYMDEGTWNPAMKRYIEILVDHAATRPVLQFNRIDFRLPWIRHHFPNATIVHLFRHPRDEWYSSLFDHRLKNKNCSVLEFLSNEGFYLGPWAQDLKFHFPFLDPATIDHPYHLFYYLWKLSYLFGSHYAHVSLAYEQLVNKPEETLIQLFDVLHISSVSIPSLLTLIEKPGSQRWKSYADETWFAEQEQRCEATLEEFLGSASLE